MCAALVAPGRIVLNVFCVLDDENGLYVLHPRKTRQILGAFSTVSFDACVGEHDQRHLVGFWYTPLGRSSVEKKGSKRAHFEAS